MKTLLIVLCALFSVGLISGLAMVTAEMAARDLSGMWLDFGLIFISMIGVTVSVGFFKLVK